MAHYLVSAKPKWDRLEQLAERVRNGEVESMQPFGQALDESMRGARLRGPDEAVWEEEDYCRPPLKMEREAVLDDYFESIEVERVEPGEGWAEISDLPKLWDSVENASLNE
ncbi:MAG: hypothetical protein R3191_00985 [Anaerolineales bacterium]|nr:hypothetical protein [Anaerolineales bacterium]